MKYKNFQVYKKNTKNTFLNYYQTHSKLYCVHRGSNKYNDMVISNLYNIIERIRENEWY